VDGFLVSKMLFSSVKRKDEKMDKIKGWLMLTGAASWRSMGIIIFFKPMMTLMFGVGNSSQAGSFPYLHERPSFHSISSFNRFIGILVYRWYQRGKNQ